MFLHAARPEAQVALKELGTDGSSFMPRRPTPVAAYGYSAPYYGYDYNNGYYNNYAAYRPNARYRHIYASGRPVVRAHAHYANRH